MTTITFPAARLAERVHALDWSRLSGELDQQGFACTDPILEEHECRDLADLFDGNGFRSTIEMARHRFGDGRYRYFDRPLPPLVQAARTAFYEHLAQIANTWSQRLSTGAPRFPDTHEELLKRCREAG
ncbi:MAG TPA: 2OG-Fe(II) oxygenase, partial [Acetobacteraceae bacterium]|nr:2OG-Fe(II) oxygenase [Acetobacteraceae bacterium]